MSRLVVVIDDSATVRKIIQVCLERAGYEVIGFPDGVEAIRWLTIQRAHLPQLVFLDIEMPRMDGYAVAQCLKAKSQCSDMVIVMLSARNGILDRLKGRLAGADDYLTKPCTTQAILALVQAHLGVPSESNEHPLETQVYVNTTTHHPLTWEAWPSLSPASTTRN
jgi:twitching motility two-component system response regulator PilG